MENIRTILYASVVKPTLSDMFNLGHLVEVVHVQTDFLQIADRFLDHLQRHKNLLQNAGIFPLKM